MNNKKRCNKCNKKMIKFGFSNNGKQRWYCRNCKISAQKQRKDYKERKYRDMFLKWITSKNDLRDMSENINIHVNTLINRFNKYWQETIYPPNLNIDGATIICDGLHKKRIWVISVVKELKHNLCTWSFSNRENEESWSNILSQCVGKPYCIVTDGHSGLYKAIEYRYGRSVLIQRCQAHLIRQCNNWLTKRPKTVAGKEIKSLINILPKIKKKRDARLWVAYFHKWIFTHNNFLKERSCSSKDNKWWYTHRSLRKVRSHVKNAMPYLFTFIQNPKLIPNTTNHVEGGINPRLRELIRLHRGLSNKKQQKMLSFFLNKLNEKQH